MEFYISSRDKGWRKKEEGEEELRRRPAIFILVEIPRNIYKATVKFSNYTQKKV